MLSVLRIVAAVLFMEHGTQKLFNFPPNPTAQTPFVLVSLIGLAGVLELFGGTALLLGLLTRPIAFLLAGQMAVAYFTVHAPQGLYPIGNRGELAALYCFLFLYFSFAGAGAWSLDALFARPFQRGPIALPTSERRSHRRRREDQQRVA